MKWNLHMAFTWQAAVQYIMTSSSKHFTVSEEGGASTTEPFEHTAIEKYITWYLKQKSVEKEGMKHERTFLKGSDRIFFGPTWNTLDSAEAVLFWNTYIIMFKC